MPKFIVSIREVYVRGVEIEAKDELEAKLRVEEGKGEYLDDLIEYSHTLNLGTWTVEEIPEPKPDKGEEKP
jgi:hypothetical protein